MSMEESIQALREAIPDGGVTLRALVRMHLSRELHDALEAHFGGVRQALFANPHFFATEGSPSGSASEMRLWRKE